MTNPDGSVVNWRGQDTLASGIYPPLPSVPAGQDAAVGAGSDRVFSKREKEALELWVGILRDGGANVKVTDHVDATRFSKVSETTGEYFAPSHLRTFAPSPRAIALTLANPAHGLRSISRCTG
jgi:2-dehydropantoate 2-reductase